MTRDEQIIEASHNYGKTLNEEAAFDYEDMKCAFKKGAKWADAHPINVWHDASEEPIFHSDIVVIDKHNGWWDIQSYDDEDYDYKELYGWEACVENYEIVRWAYISDLLPKGGAR